VFGAPPAEARAQWLIWPFAGAKFAGSTNIVDLDAAASDTKFTLGASVTLLGDGVLGIEADVAYTPRFFDTGAGLIASSSLTTVTGGVILAVPRSVTRESLRPYVVGGVGLMHVGIDDVVNVLPVDTNLLGLTLGGGAIGTLSDRTSLRFELRHFRNLTTADEDVVSFGSLRLSFWRATVGLTLRY
jgi:opacity protein-like surface antigen